MKERIAGIVILFAMWGVQAVQAGPVLVANNRGGLDQNGDHSNGGSGSGGNANFLAGTCFGCTPTEVRNFFVFDLSAVVGPITGATLQLEMQSNGFLSPEASETYVLFDYLLAASTLGPGTPGVAAFGDLGSGTSYGSVVLSAADNGTIVNISLNAAAVAAINANLGSTFVLGGAITTLSHGANVNEHAWGSSLDSATSYLELNPQAPPPTGEVPEPASALLALAGLGMLGLARRTRR